MLAGMGAPIAGFQVANAGGGGGGSGGGSSSGGLTASASPSSVSKTGSSAGPDRTLTTTNVTVTASGGAGGYTYSWARISGSVDITAGSPTSASTGFSATLAPDEERTAVFRCTVTDAGAAVATTEVSVTIALVFTGGGTM